MRIFSHDFQFNTVLTEIPFQIKKFSIRFRNDSRWIYGPDVLLINNVRQEMKKALIGNCPVCDSRQIIFLSPIRKVPIGNPRKCYCCLTPIKIGTSRPILKLVVENLVFVLPIGAIWLVDFSNNIHFYTVMICIALMPVIPDLIGYFLWKPILVTVSKNDSPDSHSQIKEFPIATSQIPQTTIQRAKHDVDGNSH